MDAIPRNVFDLPVQIAKMPDLAHNMMDVIMKSEKSSKSGKDVQMDEELLKLMKEHFRKLFAY